MRNTAEYQDLQRDPHHLSRALELFDRWIYAINRNRSMLFTRDSQSVQLGFDLDYFFEEKRVDEEQMHGYFRLDAILNRRYTLNERLIRSVPGNGTTQGYYHKYLIRGIHPDTVEARVIGELDSGLKVEEAIAQAGISAGNNLDVYLSLIQKINGLDLLRVLLPVSA